VLGTGAGVKRRRAKPVGPAGEVSCESRGGRSSNDASSEPRWPVLEGVWASWSVYRGGGIVMHTNSRFMAGSAWRYDARVRECSPG
jgi:hypothetical protein